MAFFLLALASAAAPGTDAPWLAELPTDAVLATLIEESLAARPELARAQATAQAERERVPQAGAFPDPMLQLGVQNDGFGSWQIGKMETSWYSIMASQTLPWPGKRGLKQEVAELGASEAELATTRARLSTEAEVRRDYVALLLARERLGLLDRLEAISQKSAAIARTRYEAGTGAQSDVLRAQLELNRIKQRRWVLQAEADTVLQALNRLRGHPFNEPIATSAHLAELALPVLEDESSVLADANRRSPELAAARLRVSQAERSVALARKSYLPDLTVSAGVMPRGGDFPPMWLLSVGGALPIFAASKQDRSVAETQARMAASAGGSQAVEQVLALRVQQRSIALRVALDTIRLYREGLLVQSEATAESTRNQYQVGTVTFASVLEANAGLIADQDGYLQALVRAQALAIDRAEVSLAPPSFTGAVTETPAGAAMEPATPSAAATSSTSSM